MLRVLAVLLVLELVVLRVLAVLLVLELVDVVL